MRVDHARTALGRPLRRRVLDERYPDLDLFYDDVDPAVPGLTIGHWGALEGPLTYVAESPVAGHGSRAAEGLDCLCRECREVDR